MFKHDAMCAGAHDTGIFLNGRPATRVGLLDVRFHAEALRLIGAGILSVAAEYGIPEALLKRRMAGNLFIVPPSESLYFLFRVDELEADMHIEIPKTYWRLAEAEKAAADASAAA